MQKAIKDLIDISRYYGNNKDFVIAGGGNTSYKDEHHLWVKASGVPLAALDEKGLIMLLRSKVQIIGEKEYPSDPHEQERCMKQDLEAAIAIEKEKQRPSVESAFHELINYSYVVHTHPALVNGLMCSRQAAKLTQEIFGNSVLFIPFALGYELFLRVRDLLAQWRKHHPSDPNVIFLENHGIFVSASTINEVKQLYNEVMKKMRKHAGDKPGESSLSSDRTLMQVLPAMRMILSADGRKVLRLRHTSLHRYFYKDRNAFEKISKPFIPDIIVYSGAHYLYVPEGDEPAKIIRSFRKELDQFQRTYGTTPRVVLVKDLGLIGVDDSSRSLDTILDTCEDQMRISFYAERFGGPAGLTDKEVQFIENWEVENYRRKVAQTAVAVGRMKHKIAIVTGGAMGFGAGIAAALAGEGAHVVVADVKDAAGAKTVVDLNSHLSSQQASFFHCDVGSPESVDRLVMETVKNYGGLDLMISNAGILFAGGLEEMDPDRFEKVTRINYQGYYHCVRSAVPVMKCQHEHAPALVMDIIQINSKSGLQGSNKNFAYAGAKFGGIGLTQSFAMELAPWHIKVNAICPGNYFEGPLWADPDHGLLVQYLKAGKVPGAKTIQDVKKYYESMVPLGRGCNVDDIMKAIYYIVEQVYETGQALPVTGGQVMLP